MSFRLTTSDSARLHLLLQAGVVVAYTPDRGDGSLGVYDFLRALCIPDEYIDERIQSVFVNGHPVDAVREARMLPNDTLALSAAMPGLMGATMRKGGYYASLRDSISHTHGACTDSGNAEQVPQKERPTVTLRLFNFIAPELAAHVAAHGFTIDAESLALWLGRLGDETIDVGAHTP